MWSIGRPVGQLFNYTLTLDIVKLVKLYVKLEQLLLLVASFPISHVNFDLVIFS